MAISKEFFNRRQRREQRKFINRILGYLLFYKLQPFTRPKRGKTTDSTDDTNKKKKGDLVENSKASLFLFLSLLDIKSVSSVQSVVPLLESRERLPYKFLLA